MTIPALSLWQPWASLVAIGEKRVETRSFPMSRFKIRPGPVAIHAAKRFTRDLIDTCSEEPFRSSLLKHGLALHNIPRGGILCVIELIDCRRFMEDHTGRHMVGGTFGAHGYPELNTTTEQQFGDWYPGRYGWIFGKVIETFVPAIPALGRQQIGWPWEWNKK